MRLTRLHIKGFKSFANDTVINFNEDVIGVVGPNGSGKSNIVDAIRWVLGEQKGRELRLDKMSDVLFNGTKSRKESGVAQVSMTFDNTKNILPTEYNTVTISRLLYRSGESEYRLNDVACRLKDITNLFLDTGIGSNSYAIIALGMVDDILANKENARRKMFEQAAGISKYKKRKKETFSKLKSTESDLERLEDIIYELEGSLKSLQKQAKRAEKYIKVKQAYREQSMIAAALQLHRIQLQSEKANEALRIQTDTLTELKKDVQLAEANLEKEKTQNLDAEQALSNYQKELNQIINVNRDKEHKKNLTLEKVKYNEERIAELEESVKRIQTSLIDITNNKKELTQEKSVQAEALQRMNQELEIKAQEYSILNQQYQQSKTAADEKNRRNKEYNEQLYSAEKQIAVSENMIANIDGEMSYVRDTMKQSEANARGFLDQIDQLEKDITETKNQLEQLQSANDDMTSQMDELQEEISNLQQTKSKSVRALDAKCAERDLLQNMIDNLEGYPESMKYLKQQKQWKAPILADVIEVDNHVKKSVEQYLDQRLNYYVVDNVAMASQAIAQLKEAQKGKAGFFLLDQIEEAESTAAKDGRLLPIIDRIQCEERYRLLVVHLFRHVYVFDGALADLESIQVPNHVTVLSAKGDFILQKSAISGGSIGLFEGSRLGRKTYLKNLKAQIKDLDDEVNSIDQKIAQSKKVLNELREKNLKDAIAEKNSELNQSERELLKLSSQNQNYEQRLKSDQDKIARMMARKTELASAMNEYHQQKLAVEQSIHDLSKSDDNLVVNLDEDALRVDDLNRQINEFRIKILKAENTIGNQSRELSYAQERYDQGQKSIEDQNASIKRLKSDKQSAESKIKQLDQDLLEGYAKQKDQEAQLNDIERSYFKVRAKLIEQEDDIKQQHRKINQTQQLTQEYKDSLTNLGYERKAIKDRISTEFNLDQENLDLPNVDELDVASTESQDKVERLRRQLANFGDINPLALEAYNEMQHRYDNMLEQRSDIIDAKDALLKTIEEIDATANEKFQEAFADVRTHFKRVFRSLFTDDDDCDLVLLNASSPLEAEIDIIAKPKGKKPKSLSQLSGGEKTLTATALLFALYLLKPAPFCIFDEVDAPLDDANIQKFNNIIKDFASESQFIIVTHNKMTMAEVDILYGVYMQEQGVSGISPVDFRKYEYQPSVVRSA